MERPLRHLERFERHLRCERRAYLLIAARAHAIDRDARVARPNGVVCERMLRHRALTQWRRRDKSGALHGIYPLK